MKHNALMHEADDDVAVLVVDLKAGDTASAVTLEGQLAGTVKLIEDVPLGHKVALRDLAAGKDLIKYGRKIGKVSKDIKAGQHVHTQNVKTERWQN
jgi:(2R)-sulfolactate sulfo-lyase subunit alpha